MDKLLEDIEILSLNCRGLRNKFKRHTMFSWLKKHSKGIFMLQETHTDESIENKWCQEYNGKIFFSHGTSSSRGVAIMIPNQGQMSLLVNAVEADANGRILLVICEIESNPLVLVNVYAPTKNDLAAQISFLENLRGLVEKYSDIPMIIGGDFNTYLNANKDKKGGTTEQISAYTSSLTEFIEEYSLIDIWRLRNKDLLQFTWHGKRHNNLIQSRLDFFLISMSLESEVKKTLIMPSICTDHSLISLSLTIPNTVKRGKGFWKFNNSLLKDQEYISKVKSIVEDIVAENPFNNKAMLWEYIKCTIRTETIVYSSNKAKLTKIKENEIYQNLKRIELELTSDSSKHEEYEKLKIEYENLQAERTEGIILRSKAKYAEEGEKNSKYFLNLEKRNYNNKHMKSIFMDDNTIISDPQKILDEQASFFMKLYTRSKLSTTETKNIQNEFLGKNDIPKLDPIEQQILDTPITVNEITKALKHMANDKSPGLDGFTTNFYKFFWPNIKEVVLQSFNSALQQGELSNSQRLGVISLIPKRDKDLRYIKSWRPVTLLPTDYKILAKTLALRLQIVIAKLISPDQVGYIKGRYLGQNVRTIEDIITYTSDYNLPGLLVLIDFQKAFDTVEWDFLFDTLKEYNFGPIFRSWIKLLYTDVSSCTINNGYLSKNFKLSRGIRQGCPISALLFILVAEIISLKIKANEKAKGISIGDFEYKVVQLADDTTIFMKDIKSLITAIQLFLDFEKISGLKINLEKCEIIELGSMKLNRATLPKVLANLEINRGAFKTLGVWFSGNVNECIGLNYNVRIQNIKSLIQIWRQRNLSWKGRIMIIKTLILPQVTHLLGMTFTPNSVLECLDKLCFNFLWNNKPPKIKRETIIATTQSGGLRMPDIYAFHQAQKVVGMKNLILENGKCLNLFLLTSGVKRYELNYKLTEKHLKYLRGNQFHEQILQCWFKVKSSAPKDVNEILNENIFLNRYIAINNTPIYPENYSIDSALRNIKIIDILDRVNNVLSPDLLRQKTNGKINFLNIYSIMQAIPKEWKLQIRDIAEQFTKIPELNISLNNIFVPINKITSQKVYWDLVNKKTKPATALLTWSDLFPFLEHFDWKIVYNLTYKVSKEPYLQTFQYKILNRTTNCRYNLWKWKLIPTSKCLYCSEIDTIEHHFYYCLISKNFLNDVMKWFCEKTTFRHSLSVCEVLLGVIHTDYGEKIVIALNFILLLSKWYINACKTGQREVTLSSFLYLVKEKLKILKICYSLENNIESFNELFGKLEIES